ncbi:MAG: orotidine-5'-phosphate decarboxylase [Planctomycetota bacterium]|nr:MAG: orotidine-5'-phosphate decarboxylase [Planctomycetota bacterium]
MTHVADVIAATIATHNSVACVGLDPRVSLLPPVLRARYRNYGDDPREAVAAAFLDFNRNIIDAIAGHCAAVKPQSACYEAYGHYGIACLEETIAHARAAGIPVILDGKRNDIGSTATHYREMFRGGASDLQGGSCVTPGQADWLTVNGYLGSDGITPFLGQGAGNGGIFVLVKTSNPGSAELQGQVSGDGLVMDAMARLVAAWGQDRVGDCGLSDIGAVVGATYPEEARQLRALMPQTLFLVPGYGAQGGGAADALAGLRPQGDGVLVNSSRGIIAAWQDRSQGTWADDDWAAAARHALERMNEDLNCHR